MKHSHTHTHEDGTSHGHFHEHEGRSPDLAQFPAGQARLPDPLSRTAHKTEPHEHEHHATRVTLEITFEIGTIDDVGFGGFKVGWLDAEEDGCQYDLTAGAGVGSPLVEASVRADGKPSVYARADIRDLTRRLWRLMDAVQAELAAERERIAAVQAELVARGQEAGGDDRP